MKLIRPTRGGELVEVERSVVLRRRPDAKADVIAQVKADHESGRVRLRPIRLSEYVWPEVGAIDELFREARKLRA